MYHIYSTMANSTEYLDYSRHNPQGVNVVQRSILIKGGTGINRQHFQTPMGVHTAISDADYEWLKNDPHFKEHEKNGYIKVRKAEVHPEVVAAEMVTHDRKTDACPIVPEDFSDKEVGSGLTAIKPVENKSVGKKQKAS